MLLTALLLQLFGGCLALLRLPSLYEVHPDIRVTSSIIKSFVVTSESFCTQWCTQTAQCVAYNVITQNDNILCELLGERRNATNKQMLSGAKYTGKFCSFDLGSIQSIVSPVYNMNHYI